MLRAMKYTNYLWVHMNTSMSICKYCSMYAYVWWCAGVCTGILVVSRCVDAHVCGMHSVTVTVCRYVCLYMCSVHIYVCVHMWWVYVCVHVYAYEPQIGKRKIERKGGQSHRLASLDTWALTSVRTSPRTRHLLLQKAPC